METLNKLFRGSQEKPELEQMALTTPGKFAELARQNKDPDQADRQYAL